MNAPVRKPSPYAIEAARQSVERGKHAEVEKAANVVLFDAIEENADYLASLSRSLGEAAYRKDAHEVRYYASRIVHVVRALAPTVNEIASVRHD